MNRATGKKPKMEMQVVQMIERVRAGEDAKDVIRDTDKGESEKDASGNLDERLKRFLGKDRKKHLSRGG